MRDENSRESEYDLNKILEEYSSMSKDRPSSDLSQPTPKKKKFVLHIDESLIDTQDTPISKTNNHNGSGIYFSNYQRNNSKRRTVNSNDTASGKLVERKKQNNGTQSSSKRKNKHVKRIGGRAAMVFLSFIFISTVILSYIGITCVGDMLAINRKDESVEVVIPADATYSDIIDILAENKLIKRKYFCKLFAQYRNFDESEFLSGNYSLKSSMGLEGMLMNIMIAPVSAETVQISLPEGLTVQQIFEKLEYNDVCVKTRLYSAVRSTTFTYDFYTNITDDNKRYLKLEGYLFPDTYDFYVDADANYVINKMLENFESKWTDEYQAKADKLGYTCDEIITIASIIQKEAADTEQMKLISSIIHNRLKNSANYPTIDCDSTGDYAEKYITKAEGENVGFFYMEKYDTYSNRGLPPGPICNPGMDAIRAALYPDDTDYYFFAHDKNRKIYLAKTDAEHEANLDKIEAVNR